MKYYEIHKMTVYEVGAESEEEALEMVMDGHANVETMEIELFVDKTSEEIED
jgi:hypothetical protein